MPTFACDVSYYQHAVNDSYPRQWFIFRICDGTFVDPNLGANLSWARKQYGHKLTGYTGYGVFRPGIDLLAIVKREVGNTPPPGFTFMLDVERWNGQVNGNHSGEINALIERFADWLGDKRRVLVYANQGDFAALYPNRDAWVNLVVAGYSSTRPQFPQMIGWQYSDGSTNWPVPAGYPRSTAPFGNCDHNVFPDHDPAQLAVALGVAEEDDPLADLTQKQLDQIGQAAAEAVWSTLLPESSDKGAAQHAMSTYTVWAWRSAAAALDQAQTNNKVLTGIAQVLSTAKTGVLARTAAVQTAVANLTATVAKSVPSAVEKADESAIATAVAGKVKALLNTVKLEVQ